MEDFAAFPSCKHFSFVIVGPGGLLVIIFWSEGVRPGVQSSSSPLPVCRGHWGGVEQRKERYVTSGGLAWSAYSLLTSSRLHGNRFTVILGNISACVASMLEQLQDQTGNTFSISSSVTNLKLACDFKWAPCLWAHRWGGCQIQRRGCNWKLFPCKLSFPRKGANRVPYSGCFLVNGKVCGRRRSVWASWVVGVSARACTGLWALIVFMQLFSEVPKFVCVGSLETSPVKFCLAAVSNPSWQVNEIFLAFAVPVIICTAAVARWVAGRLFFFLGLESSWQLYKRAVREKSICGTERRSCWAAWRSEWGL